MRRSLKILIGVILVLAVVILVSVIHHYQLRNAVNDYISRLKVRGEPMELAQVIPPPVPPEKNGAPLITNALAQIYLETNSMIDYNPNYNPPYDMNRIIPGSEMVGWRQPLIHGPDTSPSDLTNTWPELGDQLSRHQSDLDDFRKLIQRPILDFHADYSDPRGAGLMSHLPQLRVASQWLMASEFFNLHQGKTADACTDVRAMLALVKGETDERFEISQLVRFAIAQITADATWNILQTTNVSDQDLARLQRDWQSFEFILSLRNAFLFERASQLRLANHLRHSPTNFWQWFNPTYVTKDYTVHKTGEAFWDQTLWCWFWSYTDELRALQMWQSAIDGTQMLQTNHSFPAVQSAIKSDFASQNDPYAILSQSAIQLAAINKVATVETVRNIVITAIALKRYEIRHHHLPEALDELVPEFLKSVPTDCMDGRSLRYRKKPEGAYLLYSVGENGKDDGGNPKLNKDSQATSYPWMFFDALDWVWPQSATAQEIQQYYDRLSKNSAN